MALSQSPLTLRSRMNHENHVGALEIMIEIFAGVSKNVACVVVLARPEIYVQMDYLIHVHHIGDRIADLVTHKSSTIKRSMMC
jgi:hypothetical protein